MYDVQVKRIHEYKR
jgi:starch phosphorylase